MSGIPLRASRRSRKLAGALLASAFFFALALGTIVGAQEEIPPEGLEFDTTEANCIGHHSAEDPPLRTTMIVVPDSLSAVPAGSNFTYNVTVVNPWKHELLTPNATLNLTFAPSLVFLGDKLPYNDVNEEQMALSDERGFEFPVDDNATEIIADLVGEPGQTGTNDWTLTLYYGTIVPGGAPVGADFPGNGYDTQDALTDASIEPWHDQVRVNDTAFLQGARSVPETTGWIAAVSFDTGPPVAAANFKLVIDVFYNASKNPEKILLGPPILKPGESHTYTFDLRAGQAKGPVKLVYGAVGHPHYLHSTPQAVDDGVFIKQHLADFAVGDSFAQGTAIVATGITLDPLQKVMRAWGQVTGFSSLFLIVPSLILGGTFGQASVRTLNKAIGTARRRVLWHNSASFGLLGIAIIHTVLFIVESYYNWTFGLLWGGLATLAMVGLAITGIIQKRLIDDWGYNQWRFVHLSLGILTVFFSLVHTAIDGSHLQFLREAFGTTSS
ncbi:MAG: ferric reductase-like transmembrane domain-containing protein [Euryarchaeota archaeon]|nr:ferric reductase-like transmembrane domain-containing protein [Euryarchaeota archaeon]